MALLKDHPADIHLLITDVVMPDMNGFDLARESRRWRPALAVLCISGFLDRERPPEDVGVRLAFLQKPFAPEDLAAKVSAVLAAR